MGKNPKLAFRKKDTNGLKVKVQKNILHANNN